MNEDTSKTPSLKKYLKFILIIFCFVGIPAFILSYSVLRYFQIKENQLINNFKTESYRITGELRRNLVAEKYFCSLFHEYNLIELNNKKSNIDNTIDWCKKLKTFYQDDMDFIVLDINSKIIFNSNTKLFNFPTLDLNRVCYLVRNYQNEKIDKESFDKGIESAKKIFGKEFRIEILNQIYDESNYHFIRADKNELISPSGIYSFKWGELFVFVSNDLLTKNSHLKYIINENSPKEDITVGLYDNKEIWLNNNIENKQNIENLFNNQDFLNINYFENNDYYISNEFLSNNRRALTLKSKVNSVNTIWFKTLLTTLLYFIFSFPVIKYFYNTIILKKSGNASISLKLGFLFLFASGIPLLSLAVLSYEYEVSKRQIMQENAKSWSLATLKGMEQRYLSYLKTIWSKININLQEWSDGLKKNKLDNNYIDILRKELFNNKVHDFYCIASEASFIGSLDGIINYSGTLDKMVLTTKKSELTNKEITEFRFFELKCMNIILKKLCSDLNKKELPGIILKKVELFAESVMQKTFPEIIYSIVEDLSSIKEFGFGDTNLTLFKFVQLFDKSLTDYIIIITWEPKELHEDFINNITPKANRNPNNFKFLGYNKIKRSFSDEVFNEKKELEIIARRATEKPNEGLETITINGEEYIVISILSKNIYSYSLIGLYPMRNINIAIGNQSFFLWLLGFFCLILSLGLAQLLTKSFVNPLLLLQDGALAIENRNFDHRIPNLSKDELGEVGDIFNNVMVSLKELEIAKIVQESMFPKPEFQQGKFSIYGKSVTMIDVGGDYLDFFKVDDTSFSVLVGDVAGHGVGASVIMAMAKAAILVSGDTLHSPAAVLNQLHKMILATKSSKQRKIMTFQYMHINSETGENLFSNAGGCSPWLIRHSENTIEEIKKPGPTLGSFKKAVYRESSLDFRPGDAIVFYTDGIVECKDKDGVMFGYERLKDLLLNSWDSNPKTYYNNIYNAYLNYIGVDAKAEDDLTIIILTYNKD